LLEFSRLMSTMIYISMKTRICEDIGPYLWPYLGSNEDEKARGAKKVIEFIYCNYVEFKFSCTPPACPLHVLE
jgi:hypothetical protein